jgi:predicted glutamine amidotransferase
MCRMLGVVSATSRSFALLLEEAPRSMATLSEKHPDGWGIAVGQQGSGWTVHRSVMRAADDGEFHSTSSHALGDIIVAHVRQKTRGEVTLQNTHPFEATPWIFTHNGTVNNLAFLEGNISLERRRAVLGDTDSERLFAFLMTRLDELSIMQARNRSVIDQGLRAATREIDQLPDFGTASFLLSDGDVLYAHRLGAPLYLLQRHSSFDFNCSECARSPCIAVTTEPITDETWIPLNDGDLIRIGRGNEIGWTRL